MPSAEPKSEMRALVAALPHAAFVTDLAGVIEFANPEARMLARHLVEPLEGRRLDEVLPAAGASGEWLPSVMAAVRDGLCHQHVDVAVERPGGSPRWFEVGASRLDTSDGICVLVHLGDVTARREAEEATRLSEERFRGIFENSPISIWVEDLSLVKREVDAILQRGLDLRAHLESNHGEVLRLFGLVEVLEINERSVQVLGATSKAEVQRSLGAYLGESAIPTLIDELVALASGASTFEGELSATDSAGRSVCFRVLVALSPGQDWSRVLVSFVDVTERRAADQRLQTTSERLERALDAGGLGFYELDVPTGQLWADERYTGALGLGPDELHLDYEKWRALLHPDDVAGVTALIDELSNGGTAIDHEYRLRHRDGHWVWVRDIGRTWSEDGKPVRISGFHRDISERKRKSRELLEANQRYQEFVDRAPIGVWSMDAEHRTTFINPRMAALLGYEPADVMGRPVEEFMLPEDLADHAMQMGVRHGGATGNYGRRFRRRDGTVLHTEVSAAPLLDDQGAFAGSFGMFTDITHRRRAERELLDQQERYQALVKTSHRRVRGRRRRRSHSRGQRRLLPDAGDDPRRGDEQADQRPRCQRDAGTHDEPHRRDHAARVGSLRDAAPPRGWHGAGHRDQQRVHGGDR